MCSAAVIVEVLRKVANVDSVVAHFTRGGRERRDSIKHAARRPASK